MPHLIDCHILTLPRFPAAWVDAMRTDLDDQPVNQHWIPGIEGDLAEARARGFSAGSAPFVSSADPDDRIMPGTYAALLKALANNPSAPFAWAGEKMVDEELKDLPTRPHVWPRGYDPLGHISRANHVHGVKLYRREFVTPLLDLMRQAGPCCEFALDLAIVKPWAVHKSVHRSSPWPVHAPMVGRLWRWHGKNGSADFKSHDFDRMATALGFASMNALRDAVVKAATA
ncbi:hypothetical protein [Hydrogenophaga sp.]|uniref:hypothetical protein n=1 Tax=Hydrogenophaga sp. TaxID=1904254 RepID=UPI003D0CE3A1